MRYFHSTEALFSVTVWPKMNINDTGFDDSTSYLANAKHLQTVAAKISHVFRNLHQHVSLLEKHYNFLCQHSSGVVIVSFCRAPSSPMWQEYWMVLRVRAYISLWQTLCTSNFSKNRNTHVLLFWFLVSTTTFNTRGRCFHLQNHEGQFFHEGLCFWYWCLHKSWAPLKCRLHIFRLAEFLTHLL